MNWQIDDIGDNCRVYHTVGKLRFSLVEKDGTEHVIESPINKIDKLAQRLMHMAESGRHFSMQQGDAWLLLPADIECELLAVKDFRLMPFRDTGEVGIQFIIDGKGIAGVKLQDGAARKLANDLPDQLSDFKTEKSGDQISVAVSASTYMDLSRTKSPSAPLAIPDRFCAAIGRIVATWGQFEAQFDDFLTGLIRANSTESEPTPRQFKRRKERFRDEMRACFSKEAGILAYLTKLLNMAADLHWRRNVVAHGIYASLVNVKKAANSDAVFVDVKMEASGYHKGRRVSLTFDKRELETLYYDVAHLAGLMNAVSSLERAVGFHGSSQEISALQDFLRANHPNLPSGAMLRSQPGP